MGRCGKLQLNSHFRFPLFSVGVNLIFIVLLDRFGGNPYTNPQVANNALFHILHDIGGTEMGVVIFTALVYWKGLATLSSQKEKNSFWSHN